MKIGFPQNITSKFSGYAPDWPNSIFQRIYTRKTDKLTGLWWISPPVENFLNKNFYLKIWKFFCRFCHLQKCKILVGVLIVWVWCVWVWCVGFDWTNLVGTFWLPEFEYAILVRFFDFVSLNARFWLHEFGCSILMGVLFH